MNARRLIMEAGLIGILGFGVMRIASTPARADDTPAAPMSSAMGLIKVAMANPANIFKQMQETKDVIAKMDSDTKQLAAQQDERRKAVEELQQSLTLLKPGSQDYADQNKKLVQQTIEFDVWVQVTGKQLQEQQKLEMKQIFDKIQDAIGDIAKQDGIDLVIADEGSALPDDLDKLTVDQVRQLIMQRTILYSDGKNNLDNDVVTKLDKDYEDKK